ncbi:uncharacterized protein CbrC (UPF0167 family) [Paraburkholderia tropica]|uniref:hypothetical protein n=1 Tax=Paraburkholderia tropica TaxID=92647 RepID=UPI0011B589BA|nr:hypothetical protein [Paraburkholderia tropica]MBB3004739.1 uncharacterized protein CbrC (UPF0167 family) [Paraburkholderia tropica]MBB6323536.1 uncharacterized protein CbrC (UPF0167 family) [Paraburkholderia tropica]QNB17427.1 hypothetical protein G5S35_38190 [Paraburkholderia tropica]
MNASYQTLTPGRLHVADSGNKSDWIHVAKTCSADKSASERFLGKNEDQNVVILDYFSTEIAEEVKGNGPTDSLIWGTSATTRQARG